MQLEHKTAVVYGAAGMIGNVVARTFAREGAHVHLVGRTKATLDAVAEDIRAAGGVAETSVVDALDRAAVDAHARSLDASAGGIDISFNAVAVDVEQNVPLVDMPIDDFIGPIDGLCRTHFITATAAARHMTERGSGVIIPSRPLPPRSGATRWAASAPPARQSRRSPGASPARWAGKVSGWWGSGPTSTLRRSASPTTTFRNWSGTPFSAAYLA